MSSFRICPSETPGVTRMEFDYYHEETGEKFEQYFKFVRQVAMEDFELCEKAQENLEKGVYSEGILNPIKENGVACTSQKFPTFSHQFGTNASSLAREYTNKKWWQSTNNGFLTSLPSSTKWRRTSSSEPLWRPLVAEIQRAFIAMR